MLTGIEPINSTLCAISILLVPQVSIPDISVEDKVAYSGLNNIVRVEVPSGIIGFWIDISLPSVEVSVPVTIHDSCALVSTLTFWSSKRMDSCPGNTNSTFGSQF